MSEGLSLEKQSTSTLCAELSLIHLKSGALALLMCTYLCGALALLVCVYLGGALATHSFI